MDAPVIGSFWHLSYRWSGEMTFVNLGNFRGSGANLLMGLGGIAETRKSRSDGHGGNSESRTLVWSSSELVVSRASRPCMVLWEWETAIPRLPRHRHGRDASSFVTFFPVQPPARP